MLNTIKESFHRFIRYIKWLHMLYELNTYLSMCEPWEKVVINFLFAVTLGFILYLTCVFIPANVFTLMQYVRVNPASFEATHSLDTEL